MQSSTDFAGGYQSPYSLVEFTHLTIVVRLLGVAMEFRFMLMISLSC